MDKKNITINQMAKKTFLPYMTIKKLYENKSHRIGLDVLARICYVLECKTGDLLKYNEKSNFQEIEATFFLLFKKFINTNI